MTTNELIAQLALYPGLPVVLNMGRSELGNAKKATKVEKLIALRYKDAEMYRHDHFPFLELDDDEERVEIVNITT
jgi:hypothetical protein